MIIRAENHTFFWLQIFIILGLATLIQASAREIWIIEDPAQLSIYNRYEQRLSNSEKSQLIPNAPWIILERNYVLSDRFTTTIKAEVENSLYYLQTDETGRLINESSAGVIEKIRAAKALGDTIRTTADNIILIEPTGSGEPLADGILLHRLFSDQQKIYVKDLTGQRYGWISAADEPSWEIYHPPSSAEAYQRYLFERADRVIQNFNIRLSKLFDHLNQFSNNSIAPPQWINTRDHDILRYTFQTDRKDKFFDRSNNYLYQELKDLLYGSAYTVQLTDRELVISK